MSDGVVATVVIPCLNSGGTLRQCLDGLNAQTARRQLRVIVVDNGSEDDSVAIAEELADEVHLETTPGAAAARSLGLSLVRSRLFLSVDADCRPMSSGWAQAHLAAMSGAPPSVCAGTGALFPAPSRDWWAMRIDVTPQPVFGPDHAPLFGVGGNTCYRTSAIRHVGGFPPTRGHDWGLGVCLRAEGFTFLWVEGAAVHHSNLEGPRAYFRQMRKVGWYSAEAEYHSGRPPKGKTLEYAKQCRRVARSLLTQGPAEGYATLLKVAGQGAGARDFHAGLRRAPVPRLWVRPGS